METGSQYEIVFYDGECGLCHRAVKFVLPRDKRNQFRFAPLQGTTFANRVPASQRGGLPDSLVLLTASGALLTRSAATLTILEQLGGVWRPLGALLRIVPRPLRDALYDLAARTRKRLFARPAGVCPVVPPHLRQRFLP